MALNTIPELLERGALHEFVDNDGIEDLAILADPPCVVTVAGRKLSVRALTLHNHKKWLVLFGTMVRQYEMILESVEWPERKATIEEQRSRWQLFFSADTVIEQTLRMIEQTLFREPGNGWWRRHRRWFRKHVTILDLMDLLFYLYLWNCEAAKKNATFLLRRMGFVSQKAILFGGWSKNLGGLSGAQVTPRYGSSSSSASVLPKPTTAHHNRSAHRAPPLPGGIDK